MNSEALANAAVMSGMLAQGPSVNQSRALSDEDYRRMEAERKQIQEREVRLRLRAASLSIALEFYKDSDHNAMWEDITNLAKRIADYVTNE